MSQITYTIQTALNPELLRQALEMVLGQATGENRWYVSTTSFSAIINNETVTELTQEQVDGIGAFIEATPGFTPKFYTWDAQSVTFKENLVALREDAKAQIDVAAGKTRGKYLTSIPGQDATYIAKETECRAYAAAAYPADLTNYPWVKAEADATGLTATQAADAIILQAEQWRVLGSTIEKVRRGGKIEVDKKTKASTIATSLAATLAALQAI